MVDVMFDFESIPGFYKTTVGENFLGLVIKEQLGRYGIKVVDVENVVEKILKGERLFDVRGTAYLGSVRIRNEIKHYSADVVVLVSIKGWRRASSAFLNDALGKVFDDFGVEIMDMPVPVLEVSNVLVVRSYVEH